MPVTKYIWDGENCLMETDGTGAVQTVYTYEPEQYGNLISSRVSGTTYYHHYDALGSTRQLSNASGVASDTWIYDAWGNTVARTGATAIFLQWVGQVGYYYDSETGTFWVRARPLEPANARWTAPDPYPSTQLVDFSYSENNPINRTDPSGLDCAFAGNSAPSGLGAPTATGRVRVVPNFYPIPYLDPATTTAVAAVTDIECTQDFVVLTTFNCNCGPFGFGRIGFSPQCFPARRFPGSPVFWVPYNRNFTLLQTYTYRHVWGIKPPSPMRARPIPSGGGGRRLTHVVEQWANQGFLYAPGDLATATAACASSTPNPPFTPPSPGNIPCP